MESSEIHPFKYGQIIFNKGAKPAEQTAFSTNGARKTGYSHKRTKEWRGTLL